MIGIWSEYTSVFLYVSGITILVTFGIPIFFVPMRWARVFLWSIPQDEHLALYFGRCLGGFVCVLAVFGIYVAGHPELHPFFFQLQVGLYVSLAWVHILGAVQRVQPITETIEILLWIFLIALTLCFYPAT